MTTARWQKNANTLWAYAFVDELIRCGIKRVCISPGSRSTPLVVEFGRRAEIEDISIIDERSAGFVALGMAKASGCPTALLCTSGTAAANYFPAVCEASAAGVPLLVLTADRPRQLQDVGASQAMDQLKLYGDHVRAFFEVGQAEATADKMRYLRALACRALAQTQGQEPGPVHVNLAFRKPLAPLAIKPEAVDGVPPQLAKEAPTAVHGRAGGAPFLRVDAASAGADPAVIEEFSQRLCSADRPLFFVGAVEGRHRWRSRLLQLAQEQGIPVIAEAPSGLRYSTEDGSSAPPVVTGGDFLVQSGFYEQQGAPDLVVRFGLAPISWPMRKWFPTLRKAEHIAVSPRRGPADPEHLVSWKIRCDETTLLEAVCKEVEGTDPPGRARWLEAHQRAEELVRRELSEHLRGTTELSTPTAWHVLGEYLQPGAALFVSNSMPIRDVEVFLGEPRGPVEIFGNRGINGIDGIVSTGIGLAAAREQGPTVIVSGDVALRHDLSALLLAKELDVDATIVVLDNGGGAIFDYLPLARCGEQESAFGEAIEAVYERHFRTPHSLPDKNLSSDDLPHDNRWFSSVDFAFARTTEQLRDGLRASMDSSGLQVLMVQTDAEEDRQMRLAISQQISRAVAMSGEER